MADFRGYVTAAGQTFEALAKQMGYPVTIGFIEVGDGKLPDSESPIDRTQLVHKLKQFPAIVEQDAKNPGQWVATCYIPADDAIDDAGYFIREIGCKLINQGNGVLYAYRRVSDDWKPVITSGEAKSFIYKLRFIPSNGELLTPTIDPSVVLVDKEELARVMKAHVESRNHPDASESEKGFTRYATIDELNKADSEGDQEVSVSQKGLFKWSEKHASDDIKLPHPALNRVSLSVKQKLNQFVTAADFGITGGGHDETTALRNAFSSGLTVLFPSEIYGHIEHIGISSNTQIIANSGAVLKMLDGVDQVYHSIVSANAMSLDARLADDSNVDRLINGYVTNICIKGFKIDANYKNRPKTYEDREQGTALELHTVSDSTFIELEVVNGVQHCINARAGTSSYNKGYDYVAKYPSRNLRFIDCVTDDQLYDDGITTHDSEYIWITRCESYTPRNASNLDLLAGSNGIEIDDGSRYVWVTDCKSDGGFGGYQAKGHANTPPAHHVWFTRCHSENNHMPFVLAAVGSPSTDLESVYATCHHIYLNDCSIKNAYVFSNVDSWATEAHYLQILNTRHIYVNGLTVDGKVINKANASQSGKAIFRAREYNAYIFFNDFDLENVEDRTIAGESLFSIEANMKRLVVNGLTIDKFTKAPVLFSNSSGPNWEFRRVTLKIGDPSTPVIRVNGVGGGTLYAEKIQGSGFTVGYSLGGTDCQEHTVVNYVRRIASGESGYQKVMGYLSVPDIAAAINTELGTSYSYNIDGVENLMGRVATQLMGGDPRDSTCVTRLRFSVRSAGNSSTVTALNLNGDSLAPATDNFLALGSSGRRYTQLYAASGAINTSDGSEKTPPKPITDDVLSAWGDVSLVTFRWLEAIRSKGDDARWHFGVIAQQVRDAFLSHGLDGTTYGFLCYDKWDDEWEPVSELKLNKETGEYDEVPTGEMKLVCPAGELWGIRPDQCLFLEAAYQRKKMKDFESRLLAIENSIK